MAWIRLLSDSDQAQILTVAASLIREIFGIKLGSSCWGGGFIAEYHPEEVTLRHFEVPQSEVLQSGVRLEALNQMC